MAIVLSQTPSGAAALAFEPDELDQLRDAITNLYGAIRLNHVTGGDLGFGNESFILEDRSTPLRLISMSPKGAEMLQALAAKVGA